MSELATNSIALIDCHGGFEDGWLAPSAFLAFETDDHFSLDFFLPRKEGENDKKTISIFYRGKKEEITVHRGQLSRWGPIEPGDGLVELQVISNGDEPQSQLDDRELGVFLASVWCGSNEYAESFSELFALEQIGRSTSEFEETESLTYSLSEIEENKELGKVVDVDESLSVAEFVPSSELTHEQPLSDYERTAMETLFDASFYLSGFKTDEGPEDPIQHYWEYGRFEGREPAPWFSSYHYLAANVDVAAAGMNAFLHYALSGVHEGRSLAKLGRLTDEDIYKAHSYATNPGPYFEEFDATIGVGRKKKVKALAYYLPQFHPIDINDEQWGNGFTEWRNLPRALPQFYGHVQPRIPRDLGQYRLDEGEAMRRQVEMAAAAGLHGFCFYYYWFDGRRVLEKPIDRFLSDRSLDFPFCIMWANENWTRTWDGAESEVILQQSYDPADDRAFIEDLARHMTDPRYIRLEDRPLFFIYRPGQIPDTKKTIDRWRKIFSDDHNLEPLIFMAQGFGDLDPLKYGLDGCIEFPPHKVCQDLPPVNGRIDLFQDEYKGHIVDYDNMVSRSTDELTPEFPLIKTATPTWDNEARRPGRGMIVHGSTPAKFESWADKLVKFATAQPTFGEAIVCINAWNEWAEGAVLEPDVHYGAAYINAMSRAIFGVSRALDRGKKKILLVGHDANINGAQMLALHIGRTLKEVFGVEVAYLLGNGGPILEQYKKISRVFVSADGFSDAADYLAELKSQGFDSAITNTTPAGKSALILKKYGFNVFSLIHELPNTLASYGLQDAVKVISKCSDRVIFPAEIVRNGFENFGGKVSGKVEIYPQGLYNTRVIDAPDGDIGVREELGLEKDTRIVLGVGYADLRKGIDRFFSTGLSICTRDPKAVFLWVGAPSGEFIDWLAPEILATELSERVRILGHRDDIERFFNAANVFYLSSREDPFPSVVLEALACGLPVVGHEGCGGCDEIVARHGKLIASSDPLAAVDAISTFLCEIVPDNSNAVASRKAEVAVNYDFQNYVFGMLSRFDPTLEQVSAIVPNYNYEDHIGERLRSVFDQDYPLREVIVLDDASPDDSVKVIRETSDAFKRQISLFINEANSGSPFPQWRRGAELAKGDYIWIAEADDVATPDFVGSIVNQMRAAGSVLGFCDSRQMDEADLPLGESYKPYVNEIEAGAFDKAFDMDGPEFLRRYLSVKNVILNVSGVVFRRDALLKALEAVGEGLFEYRLAGDWRLYVELCAQGGMISYLPDVMNAHRRHSISVTHSLKIEKHLKEISTMHKLTREKTKLNKDGIQKQEKYLEECRRHLTQG